MLELAFDEVDIRQFESLAGGFHLCEVDEELPSLVRVDIRIGIRHALESVKSVHLSAWQKTSRKRS